jgi:hypothetical protein
MKRGYGIGGRTKPRVVERPEGILKSGFNWGKKDLR